MNYFKLKCKSIKNKIKLIFKLIYNKISKKKTKVIDDIKCINSEDMIDDEYLEPIDNIPSIKQQINEVLNIDHNIKNEDVIADPSLVRKYSYSVISIADVSITRKESCSVINEYSDSEISLENESIIRESSDSEELDNSKIIDVSNELTIISESHF
jgi:hypothetical protein